ncbi:MAG: 2OG-Fe(II) oxygenase [Thermoanaerobaculia bacterium]
MIDLRRIAGHRLETDPYGWAAVDALFSPRDAAALAATFPRDHYKRMADYGGEKDLEYECRELIGMGAALPSRADALSAPWRALARDLLSPAYRAAVGALTGLALDDVDEAPLEVLAFHYPPGGQMGPHPDLKDKIVTHVLYFNAEWNDTDGGRLAILRSSDPASIAAAVSPVVGNSAFIVRSAVSWHAVTPLAKSCRISRRAVTATFYRPGSVSTMWPPGQEARLHRYASTRTESWLDRLAGPFRR